MTSDVRKALAALDRRVDTLEAQRQNLDSRVDKLEGEAPPEGEPVPESGADVMAVLKELQATVAALQAAVAPAAVPLAIKVEAGKKTAIDLGAKVYNPLGATLTIEVIEATVPTTVEGGVITVEPAEPGTVEMTYTVKG